LCVERRRAPESRASADVAHAPAQDVAVGHDALGKTPVHDPEGEFSRDLHECGVKLPERHGQEHQPRRGRSHREHERFHEQLTDDAVAARTQGAAHGDFSVARRRPRVHQNDNTRMTPPEWRR
jgi:hypothetical protein